MSQSFIHQVRILSRRTWAAFLKGGGEVAILYSSSQNSLGEGNEVSLTGAGPVVAILYSSSQNSLR